MHKSNPVHIPEKHNKHFYNPSRELFRGKTKNPGINQNDPQTKGPLLSNSNVVVQENLDGMNSLVLHKQNNSTQNHNIKPLDTKLADINLNAFKQGIPDKDTQHGMPHKPLIDLINHQEQQQQQPFMPDGGNMHIHDNGPLKFPIRRLLEEKELDGNYMLFMFYSLNSLISILSYLNLILMHDKFVPADWSNSVFQTCKNYTG